MVTGAYVPEMSGAGLQCRELIRQVRSSVSCAVLTTVVDPALPLEDEQEGIPVFRVRVDPASLWSKIAAAWRITRLLIRERGRFDVLHLHGFSQKTMVAIAVSRLLGKRVVIKLTSVGHDDPVSMRARGAFAWRSYSRADRFFGVSPRFAELYAEAGLPAGRFRLIPNGVDLERFAPAPPDERRALRRTIGVPDDAVMTLFVGFFSTEKCPDVLFDAWVSRAVDDPAQTLVFVGATRSRYYEVDATIADDIRARASAAGVGDRVRFVDPTSAIEVYQRAADIFVLPSTREGLPNALLEAMACGTACVATRLPGVTDRLIDDGVDGLLVPPRDVPALTAALATATDRARSLGEQARARIVRDYSAAAMGRQYLAAYRELMAS